MNFVTVLLERRSLLYNRCFINKLLLLLLPEDAPHRGIQIPPCHANLGETLYPPSGGIEHHSVVSEPDRFSTYTGLNDYDTLFEARHGRGAIDNMPKSGEEVIATSSIGIPPAT